VLCTHSEPKAETIAAGPGTETEVKIGDGPDVVGAEVGGDVVTREEGSGRPDVAAVQAAATIATPANKDTMLRAIDSRLLANSFCSFVKKTVLRGMEVPVNLSSLGARVAAGRWPSRFGDSGHVGACRDQGPSCPASPVRSSTAHLNKPPWNSLRP
jgi:hypothetical protein